MMLAHTKYRADIDGLRAIAILSVVAYHAFPEVFRGGFIGVDVFFVISGFLISSIIFENLNNNKFNILDFYIRRINRIFPALIILLCFCLVFGWFALLDHEYRQLGKHVSATVGFISNIILWKESSYFDVQADAKPLLHMWSLGIEEQFYFFWPFLSWFAWKKRFNQVVICLFVILVSFSYNIYLIKSDATSAFYLPMTRIWEIVCGSLLAYVTLFPSKVFNIEKYKTEKIKNSASFFGFLLISIGIFTITKYHSFPGWLALLPVTGSVFILMAGPAAFFNRYFLSGRILVWFGLISYPLYLWHWSLLSFAYLLAGETPPKQTRIFVVVLSIALAWLTYKFIEMPIRFGQNKKFKTIALSLTMTLIGGFGFIINSNEGFKDRTLVKNNVNSNDIVSIDTNPAMPCDDDSRIEPDLRSFCKKYLAIGKNRPTVLIWGDSSSRVWSPVFQKIGKELDLSIIVFSHASCLPLTGIRKTKFEFPESKKYCSNLSLGNHIIESIKKINPQLIFLIGFWNAHTPVPELFQSSIPKGFITENETGDADQATTTTALKNQLTNTITKLDQISKLVVFRSWPSLRTQPNYKVQRITFLQNTTERVLIKYQDHKIESEFVDAIFNTISTKQTTFLDPAPLVCSEFCEFILRGQKIYEDSYHVTPQGSLLIEKDLVDIFNQKLFNRRVSEP